MKKDSRLSGILHVLLHMAEIGEPITSEVMAQMMRTNPVVIRRIMAGLRDAGFVRSEKGHGGGWIIEADFECITLRDVYAALGSPGLFAIGNRNDAPSCLVEQTVNAVLETAFHDAEELLLLHFGTVTLAQLSRNFHARLLANGISLDMETSDAV
ncbi:Rrf2 family transcriptional regulator [Pseudochrobactrum asaccharolyticum]|uniref:DNA-binding IscR family transcriptional regulator n=1 Tax=Pseudochrobactrum asaccharolyticum TaxID=354351 RepID=A0A366DLY3_9HYPH|nr:Rrf2 family transcriptional regulator [Pseudochrobactrum asaccharolyticum]RBO90945.1 DNA-binding IscR family transcriptional regulator [Pseudochrobactrum asaccharolyticum]